MKTETKKQIPPSPPLTKGGASNASGRISPRQIKAIHTAIGKLGMDDETYRDTLRERFGVESCKDFTWRQAEELLDVLNGNDGRPHGSAPTRRTVKYSDMDGRPGFASGAQCRLVAAMWSQVSRAKNDQTREKALNHFVKRICGVDGLRFLKGWQVEKIVKALEKMGAVKQGPVKSTTEDGE